MKLIIEIPNDKIEELQEGFNLAVRRNPEHEGMNDKQFFKQWIQDSILNAYRTGKIMQARQQTKPVFAEDLVSIAIEE